MQPVSQPSVRNYNNVSTRNNGFQYRIMPLAFNLQQRGNGSTSCVVTRCIFNIGDSISGECVYDNKKYTGKIVNIVFDEEDDPLSLYIMDSKTRMVLPIKADSAKILPKKLSENYSFDKAISSFLFDDDDEELLNTNDDVYGSLESEI